MTAALAVLVGAGLALAGVLVVAWWLRDERMRLREREVTADRWEASLRRREDSLVTREKALWWAQLDKAEPAGLTRPQRRVMA